MRPWSRKVASLTNETVHDGEQIRRSEDEDVRLELMINRTCLSVNPPPIGMTAEPRRSAP